MTVWQWCIASNVTVDVPMRTGGFMNLVGNATRKMNKAFFRGATFSDGGLQQAITQNDSLTVPGNVVKVVVFFTDGHANTIQDTLNCGTQQVPNGLWNFGGADSPPNVYYFKSTGTSQTQICTEPPSNACCQVKFSSQATGKMEPINWEKVSSDSGDAQYRAIQTANAMRSEKTIVYSIGLGNNINKDFLYQVANDPNSSTFDSTKPVGEADFAPTAADLQTILKNLLIRSSSG